MGDCIKYHFICVSIQSIWQQNFFLIFLHVCKDGANGSIDNRKRKKITQFLVSIPIGNSIN